MSKLTCHGCYKGDIRTVLEVIGFRVRTLGLRFRVRDRARDRVTVRVYS